MLKKQSSGLDLTHLFTPLAGLFDLDDIRRAVGSPKDYMSLYFEFSAITGKWAVSSMPLVARHGYSAEIWTDKISLEQVLVVFRQLGVKGWILIAFQSLKKNVPLTGIFAGTSDSVLEELRDQAFKHMREEYYSTAASPSLFMDGSGRQEHTRKAA